MRTQSDFHASLFRTTLEFGARLKPAFAEETLRDQIEWGCGVAVHTVCLDPDLKRCCIGIKAIDQAQCVTNWIVGHGLGKTTTLMAYDSDDIFLAFDYSEVKF